MLADIVPYSGQYATKVITEPHTNSGLFSKYNIFSANGYSGQPFYQNPMQAIGGTDAYNKDIYGNKDPIWYPLGTEGSNLPGVSPETFESNFSQPWAEQLLPHHPEYARYQYATTYLSQQYVWIDNFLNTPTIHSNQKFNSCLKGIAAICGINKTLATHTARHTFATTVTLINGMPIETVSALLGHSSIRTTQIYAKVVAKKVSEG